MHAWGQGMPPRGWGRACRPTISERRAAGPPAHRPPARRPFDGAPLRPAGCGCEGEGGVGRDVGACSLPKTLRNTYCVSRPYFHLIMGFFFMSGFLIVYQAHHFTTPVHHLQMHLMQSEWPRDPSWWIHRFYAGFSHQCPTFSFSHFLVHVFIPPSLCPPLVWVFERLFLSAHVVSAPSVRQLCFFLDGIS